jgi:hypothetical protein
MPKATIQNVKDEGFRTEQFGGIGATFDAYLTPIVDEAGRWTEASLGASLYAAQTNPSRAFDLLKRAEVCYASATLWKRRAAFIDSGATHNMQAPQYLERREYLAHAQAAMDCATSSLSQVMGLLGVSTGALDGVPAFATGYIETGRFPQTSPAPLNV